MRSDQEVVRYEFYVVLDTLACLQFFQRARPL